MSSAPTDGSEPRSKTGKKVLQFLISLVLALTIWLFSSLSSIYTRELPVQIHYLLPEEKIAKNGLPDHVSMLVQTTGWQLLREQFRKREIEIDLSESPDEEYLLTNKEMDLFRSDLPPAVELLKVSPDSIFISIENKRSKKIPVVLVSKLKFKTGYGLADSIVLLPDSIIATGASFEIDSLKAWETETISKKNISSDVEGTVALKEIRGRNIALSAVVVSYRIPVIKTDTIKTDSTFNNH